VHADLKFYLGIILAVFWQFFIDAIFRRINSQWHVYHQSLESILAIWQFWQLFRNFFCPTRVLCMPILSIMCPAPCDWKPHLAYLPIVALSEVWTILDNAGHFLDK